MEYRKATQILNSEEKAWRFSYLKEQFRLANLEHLFKRYIEKINHAYFTIFLLSQFCTSALHFALVLYQNMVADTVHVVLPDLVLYSISGLFPVIGIFLTQSYIKEHPLVLKVTCGVAFLLLYVVDLGLPVYHSVNNEVNFRPAYTAQLIIGCYIFFSVGSNLGAVILALFVSTSHMLVLVFCTYSETAIFGRRIGSDIIYVICINGIGVYFRFMNDIVERRGFLDRRECVKSNLDLNYVKGQEEALMLSILPKNIVNMVREKFKGGDNKIIKAKPFDDRFLVEHNDVTILYADIVNYTQMTTKLTPASRLVETLNDLFGSFDDASDKLDVMRIKFLGDCYYCVAGLPPKSIEHHADACVDLGLRMIEIIKTVRENRDLEIDMRIGIHTGSIIAGIIGTSKWQYDIWSRDVYIANRMETTGSPGKVHITHQTRQRLRKTYNVLPTSRGAQDAMLAKYNIETYLISPEVPSQSRSNTAESTTLLQRISENSGVTVDGLFRKSEGNVRNDRRVSGHPALGKRMSGNPYLERRFSGIAMPLTRRTAFMDNNINRYQKTLQDTNRTLEEAIESMPLSKYEQWFKVTDINSFVLLFKDWKKELGYLLRPDPLFKYYLLSEILVLSCIILIQNISVPQWEWSTLLELCVIVTIVVVLVPFTWTHYFWNTYQRKRNTVRWKDTDDLDDEISYYDSLDESDDKFEKPKNAMLLFLYETSATITRNVFYRTAIYVLLVVTFTVCVFSEMLHCDFGHTSAPRGFNLIALAQQYFTSGELLGKDDSLCVIPWHMTETCALVIAMNFLFLRVHAWLKFLFGTVIAIVYSICVWNFTMEYYEDSETYNHMLQPYIAHIMNIVFLTFTLHLVTRQSDYLNRLDYKWNQQLIEEEEEANLIRETNYNLLRNILPIHVANIYLNVKRPKELYCEEYENVAVMFASIVDFDIEGLTPIDFVTTMDQVIGDFDELLTTEEFKYKIEKIKLANWTYMAACGLDPGRRNTNEVEQTNELTANFVVTLLKFAVRMRTVLRRINREARLRLKLRIGICYGEVTAGVVGSRKPLYDIWGDTVNMASRMDSTGIPDEIQVTQKTALILEANNVKCKFRGYIYVKGKSKEQGVPDVPTYFVAVDDGDEPT